MSNQHDTINIMISSRGRTMPALQDEVTPKQNYNVIMGQTTINHRAISDVVQQVMSNKGKQLRLWVLGEKDPIDDFPVDLLVVMLSDLSNENISTNTSTTNIHSVGVYTCTKKDSDNLILVNVIPKAVEYGAAERYIQSKAQLYGI